MKNLDFKKLGLKAQLLIGLGLLILLSVIACAGGWIVHAFLARQASTPPPKPTPMITPLAMISTLNPSPTPLDVPTTVTRSPTVTPRPTNTPEPEIITVQRNEGLYQVCRRHCPGRWPDNGIPSELDEYARKVTELNNLFWPPIIYWGQKLKMPPCPQ